MRRSVSLFALALVLAFSQGPAQAQVVKPFKITGGGPAPDGLSLIPGVPGIHDATGQATALGRYSCAGMFTLLGYTNQTMPRSPVRRTACSPPRTATS